MRETSCCLLDLSIINGIISTKIYGKRDDFNFEIVNFSFLDGDVPSTPSYGVYISQLIRFARIQEVFYVYLNKLENAVFILFSLYFVIINLNRLV